MKNWQAHMAYLDACLLSGDRAAGWGIYDDTPDMDRAIAISDAYYGDHSSIVWLYQQTGKLIMIQNVDV